MKIKIVIFAFLVCVLSGCRENPGIPLGAWDASEVESATGKFKLEKLDDRYKLLFLGYTHCPTICSPGTLNLDRTAMALGPLSAKVHFLFLSIDPERDSPEVLAAFQKRLDAKHVMFLRPAGSIDGLLKELGYIKRPGNSGTIDHSPFLYLISPKNEILNAFPVSTTPARLAEEVRSRIQI